MISNNAEKYKIAPFHACLISASNVCQWRKITSILIWEKEKEEKSRFATAKGTDRSTLLRNHLTVCASYFRLSGGFNLRWRFTKTSDPSTVANRFDPSTWRLFVQRKDSAIRYCPSVLVNHAGGNLNNKKTKQQQNMGNNRLSIKSQICWTSFRVCSDIHLMHSSLISDKSHLLFVSQIERNADPA